MGFDFLVLVRRQFGRGDGREVKGVAGAPPF